MNDLQHLRKGDGCLHVFARLAELDPTAPFLHVDGVALNRREFLHRVSLWSGALSRQGVVEGDFVALVAPNCIDWCLAFWALVSLGARPVPLDPQAGVWEVENILATVEFKLCISTVRFRNTEPTRNLLAACSKLSAPPSILCIDAAVPNTIDCHTFLQGATSADVTARSVSPDDWLMLACTSGTTGNPKFIAVPHRGFLLAQQDMAATLEFCSTDRALLSMPLYHQGGLGMGLQVLVAGGEAQYESVFDPSRFLQAIEDRRITIAQLSATLAKLLLSHPRFDEFDLNNLRLCYFAGELLPDEVAARFWRDRRIRVINVIGSSETATMVMWDSERDAPRPANEFRALPFTSVRIGNATSNSTSQTEADTLWIRTDAVLLEYYRNPEETLRRIVSEDDCRWFDTQDLVVALPDGYVRFVGRLKRVIKRGPNLVHPEELEAFLLTHAGVAAVAVLREAHDLYGESIVAWTQPAPETRLSPGELRAFCLGKIAAYKIPDRFVVVEELPISIGKIQYKRIRTDA